MRKHAQRKKTNQPRKAPIPVASPATATVTTLPTPVQEHRAEVPDEPAMLTYQRLSSVTGIRVGTLYGMVCRNEIPHYRLAARIIRFSASEIAGWMSGRHQPAREAGAE